LSDPLGIHLRKEHAVEAWTSDFTFSQIGVLNAAIQEDQKQCSHCGLICTTETSHLYHLRAHHGVNPLPFNDCPFCSTSCSNFKELRSHVLRLHCNLNEFSLPSSPEFDLSHGLQKIRTFFYLMRNVSYLLRETAVMESHLGLLGNIPKEIHGDEQGDKWDLQKLQLLLEESLSPTSEGLFITQNEAKCFSCNIDFDSHLKK
ncbi:Uncharacterized protein FKW44_019469, partial [Caligus rogercresseyi]